MGVNDITAAIIDSAVSIHGALGPGLFESVYQKILTHELRKRGFSVAAEVPIAVIWDGVDMGLGFRADLLVADEVIVELKSAEDTPPVYKKQILTYLKVSHRQVGLLLNFGAPLMKDGIFRLVNNFEH